MSRDIEVGRFGVRTFRVDVHGRLLPISRGGDRFDWQDGVCFAECKEGGLHRAPSDGCSCGIYSFHSLEDLRSQYRDASTLVAVIAPEGRATVGVNGVVSERARVVAVWTADPSLAAIIQQGTRASIRSFNDLDVMLRTYSIRYSAAPQVHDSPQRLQGVVKALGSELLRSAGGVGWTPILRGAALAVVLSWLHSGFNAYEASAQPQSTGAAIADLVEGAHRVVLAASDFVVPVVLFLLMAQGLGLAVQLGVMFQRGMPGAAVSRMARHAFSSVIRRLVPLLTIVAVYAALNGRCPAPDIVIATLVLMFVSSWVSGGAAEDALRSLGRRSDP